MREVIQLADQVAAAIAEPLTVEDLVTCLRLGSAGDEEDYLLFLASAAREAAEKYTNRCFRGSVAFRERFYPDQVPNACGGWPVVQFPWQAASAPPITLYRGPLLAVTSVLLAGSALDLTTCTILGGDSVLPRLQFGYGVTTCQLIEVQYMAGTGTTGADDTLKPLPPPFLALQAMKLMAGHWYENRESQEMPPAAMQCLDLVGRLEA